MIFKIAIFVREPPATRPEALDTGVALTVPPSVPRSVRVYICAKQVLAANSSPHPMTQERVNAFHASLSGRGDGFINSLEVDRRA